MSDKKINTIEEPTNEKTSTTSRRDFLKKAGMFALYTPPAITMLMNPSQARMMRSPGGHRPHKRKRHGR